ncbi:MAG TPA: hypothetical protein VGU01_08525 [Sphingomicrobium sp.]|nr:hypothetical protein [Sphingomicrobium sp.]
MTIVIELVIVIIGVFVGTQVSNWNANRLEHAQTQRMLTQLSPQLNDFKDYMNAAQMYFSVTRRYADTALAGWHNDPRVSNREFVIAAYQSSQVYGWNAGASWANVLGLDRLRDIDDPEMRSELAYLASANYAAMNADALDTPYRRNVRRIVPLPIQDAIRKGCGDRFPLNHPAIVSLPRQCPIAISAGDAAEAAAALRRYPDLVQDLQWHIAAVESFTGNLRPFEYATRKLLKNIAQGKS